MRDVAVEGIDDILAPIVTEPLAQALFRKPYSFAGETGFKAQVIEDVKTAQSAGRRFEEQSDYKGFSLERWVRVLWKNSVNGALTAITDSEYVDNKVEVRATSLGNVYLVKRKKRVVHDVEIDSLFELDVRGMTVPVIVEVSFGGISHKVKRQVVRQLYRGAVPYIFFVRAVKNCGAKNIAPGPIPNTITIKLPETSDFGLLAEELYRHYSATGNGSHSNGTSVEAFR